MESGFLGLALRQRFITRWALMDCRQPENLLSHSAVVALLAYFAGELARQNGKEVSVERMMAHGLLHDVPEIIVQDVISPVKYANPLIAEGYAILEKQAEKQLLATAPPELKDAISIGFSPGGYEQALTKACDKYAAYIKCRQEVAAGNEMEFNDALMKEEMNRENMCKEFPEMATLHDWFTKGLSQSVDALIQPFPSKNEA